MTTEPSEATAAKAAQAAAHTASAAAAASAAAHKEAYQYWGYLIKEDKCGTDMFDRLLKGLAEVIGSQFSPSDSPDITPAQLAAFYRAVGGDYDVLFIETPPSSLSFIYRSLGAFHSLQPAPGDDGYSMPVVPALKQKGFVTWQTVQLLLGPEVHVPFLQKAVALFDVVDPETRSLFPKLLPKECFPDRPDDAMETWYQSVAQKLESEAEDEAAEKMGTPHVRVETDEPIPRTSSGLSGEGSADERHGAARYFEDPLYRRDRTRPPIIRHVSRPPRAYVQERGRLVTSSVRHMLNPFGRKKSASGRHDDHYSDEDPTPTATTAPLPPLRYAHKRPNPPRREDSLSTTDSESDSDGPSSRHRTPALRHRRSHDAPTSPREYFPKYHEERRSHDTLPEARPMKGDFPPAPLYGPTKSPLFATHVAQKLQAHNYYDRRPSLPVRASYQSSNARYGSKPSSPRDGTELPYVRDHGNPPYARERDHERDRDRDRDDLRARPRHHHRRRSEEYLRDRDRDGAHDRSDHGRTTRSHDRLKDEWDERDRSDKNRDRDRDRGDRDRDRNRESSRTHRYVSGVQDGVGGRKYAVEQPWR